MKRLKKVFKWSAFGLGALTVLMVAAAIFVPLFVEVDRFRPQLIETANQYIHGKLELGKLRLSLWGQVKVQVAGFKLLDAKGQEVVSAQDVHFRMPFSSLISGAPELTLILSAPEVKVVKDVSGINVLSLVKTSAEPSSAPVEQRNHPALPALVIRARVGMQMQNAKLSYIDKLTDFTFDVDSLNVGIRDFSLLRPTEIQATALLDTRMGKQISLRGPASVRATLQPTLEGTKFDSVALQFKAELDGVEIRYGEYFHKVPGILCHLEGTLSGRKDMVQVSKAVGRFHNAELDVAAEASGFSQASPKVRFSVRSNSVSLGPWGYLVPVLKAFELSGHASFKAEGSGTMDKLNYSGEGSIQALKIKSSLLKSQPQIDAAIKVVTDKVERMGLELTAPGNDLRIKGSVTSFSKPKVRMVVSSSGMDLDQMIVFPKAKKPPAPASSPQTAAKTSEVVHSSAASGETGYDYDALLDSLRNSPVARNTDLVVDVAMNSLKAMNIPLERIEGQMSLQGLVASLRKFHLSVFDSEVTSEAAFSLKPKAPTYDFSLGVNGLDMKRAVASQFEVFQNSVLGVASFKMKGMGASFNPGSAVANLKADGAFSVLDARFATLDVGRMATDAVNKALEGLESKVPQVRGKKLTPPANTGSGFEKMSASFSISKSVFSMPDFQAISGKNRGFDLKGVTTIGLADHRLSAEWDLIDTNNLTGARNISVEVNGVRVDPLLAAPNQPVRFPIKVGGTLFRPEPSYTAVAESLARTALANMGRAAEAKIKAEATAKVQSELKKLEQKAPPAVQKAIENLGKRFKF